MSEVNFYKLSEHQFYKVFPRLIEGIVNKGNKVLILSNEDKQIEEIDELLWTYSQLSFLPHATYKDDVVEGNLAYITNSELDNKNNANFVVILSNNNTPKTLDNFQKYIFFYNDENLNDTYKKISEIQKLGATPIFIHQDNSGQWIKSQTLV